MSQEQAFLIGGGQIHRITGARGETRGAMFFPANSVMWRLTDKGREFLTENVVK